MPAKLLHKQGTQWGMVPAKGVTSTMSPSVATVSDNLAGMTLSYSKVCQAHTSEVLCCPALEQSTQEQVCEKAVTSKLHIMISLRFACVGTQRTRSLIHGTEGFC